MIDAVELEARISALELVVLTHVLQAGLPDAAFDPRAFATSRRDAWAAIARSMCEGCGTASESDAFTRAYSASLERLGHLLVSLADPIQDAIDEIDAADRVRAMT